MSEQSRPFNVAEPRRPEGPYTAWRMKDGSGRKSNFHTYLPDSDGKFRVTKRADFESQLLLSAMGGGDHGTKTGTTVDQLRAVADESLSKQDADLRSEVEKDISSGDVDAMRAVARHVIEEFNNEIDSNGHTERSLCLDALHSRLFDALVGIQGTDGSHEPLSEGDVNLRSEVEKDISSGDVDAIKARSLLVEGEFNREVKSNGYTKKAQYYNALYSKLLAKLVDMQSSTSDVVDSKDITDDGARGDVSVAFMGPDYSGAHEGDGRAEATPSLALLDLLKKADPALHREYEEARAAYVTAHANERGADFGGILQSVSKKGGWLEQARNKVGKTLNTKGYKRREALARFEELDIAARRKALAEYEKYEAMDDRERREKRMLLDARAAQQLEYDISIERREIDRKTSPFKRKAALIGGLGAAAVWGAATSVFDGEGRGGRDHPLWLGGAVVVGAMMGYAAEKASRESFAADYSRAGVKARADAVYRDVQDYYRSNPSETMEDRSVSVDRMEYVTYELQDKNLSRGRRTAISMALGGAVVAGATHWALESDLDTSRVKGVLPDDWFDGTYEGAPPEVSTPPPQESSVQPTPPSEVPVAASPPDFNLDITFPDITIDIDLGASAPPPAEVAPVAPETVVVYETVGQGVYINPGYGVSHVVTDYAAANRIELPPGRAEFIAEQLEPLGSGGIFAGQELKMVDGDFWIPNAGPDNFTPEAQRIVDMHLDTNGDQILNEHDMTEIVQSVEVSGSQVAVGHDEGFSHVVQKYAAANGIAIDGSRALEVFLYVNDEIGAKNILEGVGVYSTENGLPGISDPGTYTMTPEAQSIINEQLGIGHVQ